MHVHHKQQQKNIRFLKTRTKDIHFHLDMLATHTKLFMIKYNRFLVFALIVLSLFVAMVWFFETRRTTYLSMKKRKVGSFSTAYTGNNINTGRKCSLEFVRYEPSKFELYWMNNIDTFQEQVCEMIRFQWQEAQEWSDGAAYLTSNASALFDPNAVSDKVFSKFIHRAVCTNNNNNNNNGDDDSTPETFELMSWIEPIAGLTRHPLFCIDKKYLMSPDAFVPGSLAHPIMKASTSSNQLYLDAGAGLFQNYFIGVSQSWFYDIYQKRDVKWTRFIGWDAKTFKAQQIFSQVPGDVLPIYSFFNIPCSSGKDDPNNPLNFIRKLAKPEDFVVFKLDIDTPEVELPIVEQIIKDPVLPTLIDEMFFEHHVDVKEMRPGWGDLSMYPARLKDTYQLLTTLRKKGVRMHSWF